MINVEYPGIPQACMDCVCDTSLRRAPADAAPEELEAHRAEARALVHASASSQSAPEITWRLAQLRAARFGARAGEADWPALNARFNALMLERSEAIRAEIERAEDPLQKAVQYAMIGNYIDFAALKSVNEAELNRMLEDTGRFPVDARALESLRACVRRAGRLAYLTDNCGEIVLDGLLIRQLRALNPNLTVTVIVRGGVAMNDATLSDAAQTGLDRMEGVRVIDSGSAVTGTPLKRISREALSCLDEADAVISKGQGNYETLQYSGLHAFYIFLCKCPMFMRRFGVAQFTGMLLELGEAKA